MADSKITALTSISTSTDPANDPLVIVDVSDTSMAASGTTKKVTLNQLLGASGTATLASATITGDLTVDTSTLYVSSSADKVGIGTTSLSNEKLTVAGNISANAWLGRSNISAPTGDCSIFRSADNTLGFGIASSTAMTLNSTGLGVGGSPSYKLSSIGTTNNQVVLHVGNTAGTVDGDTTNVVRFAAGSGANALWANARYDGFSHAWRCNSTTTQAMTLDASGRLLVGKTSGVNNIETVGAGVDGRGTVSGVSTVATTIYTIKQSATAAMCVVFGDDGSNGFCDIVLFLATVAPKVVSSQTLYGSPAARTYSTSTTNLQLALASGTLSIRTAVLSTLNT